MTNNADKDLEQVMLFLLRLTVLDGEHKIHFSDLDQNAIARCVKQGLVSFRGHHYFLEKPGRLFLHNQCRSITALHKLMDSK